MKNSKGLAFMGSGFELLGITLAAMWLGGKIDEHFKLKLVGTAILLLLGIAAWAFHFLVLINKITKAEAELQKKEMKKWDP